ncbi:unnamed protein product [Echinostoma caproni]|uniref:Fungal_trans domain-containing protein n=1 Tax=Echinostoma caproni TaxID=27848 RepID=A0A183B1H8_9TREM|nr:unnamed protein product [Echinostoma caproni]
MVSQVEAFIQDNSQAIRELRNLELIRLNRTNPLTNAINAALRIYIELLESFQSSFPCISTTNQLLYWGFIRTRIAGLYLEAEKYPTQLDRSDMFMLNIFAGLFQSTFNLLAASLSVRNVQQPGTSDLDQSDLSAMHWLHSAKRVHELYLKQNPEQIGPTFWETIQFLMYKEHEKRSDRLPGSRAYQLANEPDHAAACCQLTLSRQLTFARPFHNLLRVFGPFDRRKRPRPMSARRTRDSITENAGVRRRQTDCISAAFHPFDRVEWATNAASLAQYYETVEQSSSAFYGALECYISALA